MPIAVLETWSITGMLTSQVGLTDINAQIAALMAAYAIHGQDLILYLPDGTPSASQLLSANSLGGTRVVQAPSFPGGKPAERVGFASYTAKVAAEIPVIEGHTLVDYHESLKFRGGVPVIGWLEPVVGLPVQQLWKQLSTFKVTQEGHATGYDWQPLIGFDVGIPIWPAALLPDKTELDTEAPDRQGIAEFAAYKNFKVSWHYEFESLTPLIGNPNPWPANL
ncbi:MAG TPA: hypothetical protein VG826_04210 [Pirellulales bacterium]|nr:hypothetical protein [Pirellulales bacterium]